MNATVNIENANNQVLDTIASVLKSFKGIKFNIDKQVDYSKIEKEILEAEKELAQQRKNGTLKTYATTEEMTKAIFND